MARSFTSALTPGHLRLGLRLHVELRRECVDGAGELLTLLLDLGLDLLGGLRLVMRRSPFTVATSCLMPSIARSGFGAPASATLFLPNSAATPAARRARRRR